MKTNLSDNSIVLNPEHTAKTCAIWLHGLGADGYDLLDIIPTLNLPKGLGMRHILPHAPIRPVTISGGMEMNAWFDIDNHDLTQLNDELGIRKSAEVITKIIDAEINSGISSNSIILAGFSQGGAIALQCGLRYPKQLGGILALSSFLPLQGSIAQEKSPENQNTPIYLLHGIADPLVPVSISLQNYNYLTQLGYKVKRDIYNIEHTICQEEISTIAKWLCELFH